MPGFNQTGPAGMGPMTGWGRGMCNYRQSRVRTRCGRQYRLWPWHGIGPWLQEAL